MIRFAIASLIAGFGLAALTAQPALSAAATPDCPPAGHLPRYSADPPELRAYNTFDFKMKKSDDEETVTVAGKKCSISYASTGEPMANLEIQMNYKQQMAKADAQLIFDDGSTTNYRMVKGGVETWINVYSQETSIEVNTVEKQAMKQTLLPPSGADYKLIGHMPSYAAGTPEKRNFDERSFSVKDGDDTREVKVQGARITIDYSLRNNATPSSDLEIQANYRNALKAAGAEILLEENSHTVAKFDQNGQQIWADIYSQSTSIEINVIEEKAFEASIKPPTAAAMKTALDKESRVSLYVNFDFNKATLKPDAAPVIAQIVALMKANPTLKIAMEGNTDNVGTHDYNVKLSEDRAAAVVNAVAAGGVSKDRMTSAGHGPDNPVADNDTSEGRAKNRRVDLVKGIARNTFVLAGFCRSGRSYPASFSTPLARSFFTSSAEYPASTRIASALPPILGAGRSGLRSSPVTLNGERTRISAPSLGCWYSSKRCTADRCGSLNRSPKPFTGPDGISNSCISASHSAEVFDGAASAMS